MNHTQIGGWMFLSAATVMFLIAFMAAINIFNIGTTIALGLIYTAIGFWLTIGEGEDEE